MSTNPGGILSLWKGSIPLGLASVVRHFITSLRAYLVTV
jgi:hypothetical protein